VTKKTPEKPCPGGRVKFRSLLFLSAAAIFVGVQVLAVSHRVQAGG
jgi:hypothetical protein